MIFITYRKARIAVFQLRFFVVVFVVFKLKISRSEFLSVLTRFHRRWLVWSFLNWKSNLINNLWCIWSSQSKNWRRKNHVRSWNINISFFCYWDLLLFSSFSLKMNVIPCMFSIVLFFFLLFLVCRRSKNSIEWNECVWLVWHIEITISTIVWIFMRCVCVIRSLQF